MSIDLIISENGNILIASNHPLPQDVTRVDFIVAEKSLVLNCKDDSKSLKMNVPVHDSLVPALRDAPSALVLDVQGGRVQSGFNVPLIQVEP
jgi:hypothetical protein